MSEFVDDCRREWKRLGVSDAIANEMAADLQSDLDEAARDGVSAEEVLGSGAFDPPSFASSWASERGVVPQTPTLTRESDTATPKKRASRPRLLLLGLAASGCVAVIGFALLTAHTSVARAVTGPGPHVFPFPGGVKLVPPSDPRNPAIRIDVGSAPFHTLGVILLLLGTVGFVVSLVSWLPSREPGRSHPSGSV